MERCRRGHMVPVDDFYHHKDGTRYKHCKSHTDKDRAKHKKRRAIGTGTIQEEEGPDKGKVYCSHDHWAPAEDFDPGYKTCRNCLENQVTRKAKRKNKSSIGSIYCSGHDRHISLEAFGPLKKDNGEPYKVSLECRGKAKVRHAQGKADRIELEANLTPEQLSLYCMTCHNFQKSSADLVISTKTRNGEIVEYNQCHKCYENRLDINLTNQLKCHNGICGAKFETRAARQAHIDHECEWVLCHHCKASVLREQKDAHIQECLFKKCPICAGKIALNVFEDHKVSCELRLHARQEGLEAKGMCVYLHGLGSLPCQNAPMAGFSFCKDHNFGKQGRLNTVAEKKKILGLIFGPEGQRAIEKMKLTEIGKELSRFSELMDSHPQQAIFGDTEFIGHQQSSCPRTCQVALSNGLSEDVVSNTTLKYPKTKAQQYKLWKCADQWRAQSTFKKFYGIADNGPTMGINGADSLDWEGISSEIKSYYTKHGLRAEDCFFVEWSKCGYLDYKNIKAGLETVEKDDPENLNENNSETSEEDEPETLKEDNPLPRSEVNFWRFWGCFRNALGFQRSRNEEGLYFSLNLGNLYSILYPADKKTLETQHTAGTDVKMLIAVAKFLLRLWNGKKERHRIDWYWKPKAKAAGGDEDEEEFVPEEEDEEEEDDLDFKPPPAKRQRRK